METEPATRPVSRRGGRGGEPPSTSVRPITGAYQDRPMSTVRVGTASRIASALSSGNHSSANNSRIGTVLGFAENFMIERPVTQQGGLSGLPTSYGKIGTASDMRMVKDKRYWQAVLQSKMNEMIQEMGKFMNSKQSMEREQSAKKLYAKKAKDAAKELTDLQAQLVDMNIALDSFGSGTSRQYLQNEARAIQERNEAVQGQLESLFEERRVVEDRNKQLEKEIEIERNKIKNLVQSFSPEDQVMYKNLQNMSEELKRSNMEMQQKLETLINQRERMNAIIQGSQVKKEALNLKENLNQLLKHREALKEKSNEHLTPEQLLQEVRVNNRALTSIGHQTKLIENQISEKRELLQMIEKDLEEDNSERHSKFKELKRRDRTMTDFLETFDEQAEAEKRNIEILKNNIAYAIEQMTLQGIKVKSQNMANLDLLNDKTSATSENLLETYRRLSIQLKQLQILEKRTVAQHRQLVEEQQGLLNEIRKYGNLQVLRDEAENKTEQLSAELEELKRKKKITENVVNETRKKNQQAKQYLRNNKSYKQISHLEERVVDLMRENKQLREVIDQNYSENNYEGIRNEVEDIVEQVNRILLEKKSSKKTSSAY